MGDPFCEKIRSKLIETAKELNLNFHPKGTVVTIEGPRFSSRAESNMYRQLGCDVINMSTVPEVVLAREAGLTGYKLVFNVGREGGQVIDHLHLHILGGWKNEVELISMERAND